MANDATAKYITDNRKLLINAVDLAGILCFGEDREKKRIPAISKLVEFYLQVRKEASALMGAHVPPEHLEYLVITEFSRVFFDIAEAVDKKSSTAILYVGSDVLLLDKRNNNTFSLRPWVVLFERFLESQKNTEWSIPVALFASWTKPNECVFAKTDMALIIRAHLSALARRLNALDSDEAMHPIRDLLSADSQVMIVSGTTTARGKVPAKQAKSLLAKAKRNLIVACHQTLTNISLYRKLEGLEQ